MSPLYLLDSNFFIQSHRASFPLDVVKSFWDKVRQLAQDDVILSIDKVKEEIYRNEDDLKSWCVTNLPSDFFKETSQVTGEYSQVASWAASMSGHYQQRAIEEFLDADAADAWLVAYALAKNLTIVTHEVSAPDIKRKIKIPEACTPIGVSYINPIQMFRDLGKQF